MLIRLLIHSMCVEGMQGVCSRRCAEGAQKVHRGCVEGAWKVHRGWILY